MKIITAFVLSTSLFLANVQAQERPLPAFPSITITGEAKHEVPPDFAKLTVTIRSNDEKNDKALLFHDQKLKKFMQVVDSLDKKQAEVDSSNFSLYQQKESVNIELAKLTKNFIPPKAKYYASTQIVFKIHQIAVLNTLLNQLLATDEAEFERVTFHNNNPSSHTLEAQRKAIIDAKEQGKVISNAANVTLVEIYTIRDHSPSDPDGQADLPRRSAIISGFTKQIVPPRNLNYGSKIDVVWRIKTNE